MKSSEHTLWFQSYRSKASQMVKRVHNTTAFWEVFLLRKDKSTISEYSPVFDFQLLSGKALRQGEDQISICTLIELILMKSSEYTLWFQSHQSKTSQMVKKVFNTTPFQGTLSPAQRQVNNQWCSPVYWFSAFGWNRIRTGGKSNLYLTPIEHI